MLQSVMEALWASRDAESHTNIIQTLDEDVQGMICKSADDTEVSCIVDIVDNEDGSLELQWDLVSWACESNGV